MAGHYKPIPKVLMATGRPQEMRQSGKTAKQNVFGTQVFLTQKMDSILDRFLLLGGPKTGSTALRFGLYPTIFIGALGHGHQEAPRALQTPVSEPDFVSKNCYIQG